MPQSVFTFSPGAFDSGPETYTGYESAEEYWAGFAVGSINSGDPNNILGNVLFDCLAQVNNDPPENPTLVLVLSGSAPLGQSAFTSLITESEFGVLTFQSAAANFETDGNIGIWVWDTSAVSTTLAIYSAEAGSYQVTVDLQIPPPACQDLGRETRAYVSAYDRSKVQQSRLYRFARRCLIANFNGAISPSRTIVSAVWRTDAPEVGVISAPAISANQRETRVLFASQLGGWANIRVDATLDNGELYTQVFRVNVREASYFFDDPPSVVGPFSVLVTVP